MRTRLPPDQHVLILDVDQVLVNFHQAVCDVINNYCETDRWTPADITEWDFFEKLKPDLQAYVYAAIESPRFCANIVPFVGAQDFVKRLRARGTRIRFATTPWAASKYWERERSWCLRSVFRATDDEVIQTTAKHLLPGTRILDDKPDNVITWHRHNPDGVGLLFDMPHNRNATWSSDRIYRVTSYEDAEDYLY